MLLDRYLIREIGASFAAVAIILTVIFLAYSLTRFLADAAGGLLSAPEVARLTAYKSAIALEVLLPLAFYFGVIGGCGRLNQHNELIVLRACGVTKARRDRPLLLLGLLLAAVVAALSVNVRPWAYGAMFQLKDTAAASTELDRIKPQRFYLYEDRDRTVYVERSTDRGRALRGIFIRTRQADGLELITAPRGELAAFVSAERHRLVLHAAGEATRAAHHELAVPVLGQPEREADLASHRSVHPAVRDRRGLGLGLRDAHVGQAQSEQRFAAALGARGGRGRRQQQQGDRRGRPSLRSHRVTPLDRCRVGIYPLETLRGR